MLNDNQFRRTEALLYQYFQNANKLKQLQHQLEMTENLIKNAKEIERVNRELATSIGMTANYVSERVQGGSSIYSSPVESGYLMIHDKLDKLKRKRVKLSLRILDLKEQMSGITFAINQLDDTDKKILKYIYRDNMTLHQISRIMGEGFYSHNTVKRRRKWIVERISGLLQ